MLVFGSLVGSVITISASTSTGLDGFVSATTLTAENISRPRKPSMVTPR